MSNVYNNSVNSSYQIPVELQNHNVEVMTFDDQYENFANSVLADKIVTIIDLKAEASEELEMVEEANMVNMLAIAVFTTLALVLTLALHKPIFLLFLVGTVAAILMMEDESGQQLKQLQDFLNRLENAHKNLTQPEFLSWAKPKLGDAFNLEQLLTSSRLYTRIEQATQEQQNLAFQIEDLNAQARHVKVDARQQLLQAPSMYPKAPVYTIQD